MLPRQLRLQFRDLTAVLVEQGLVVQNLVALGGNNDLLDPRCKLERGLGLLEGCAGGIDGANDGDLGRAR
jgi:hypothetical protein